MKKEYRYFTEAYRHYTGKLYNWDEQGNPEEQDAYTRGLYHGFILAKKGQDALREYITILEGKEVANG
jgi:hypothetical protein